MLYSSDLSQLGLGVHQIVYNPSNPEEQSEAQRLIDQLNGLVGARRLPAVAPVVKQHLLEEVIERFLREAEAGKRQSTIEKYRHSLRLFLGLMGNMPIIEVNQTTLGDFKGKLEKLPAHASKKPATKGKTLAQLVEEPTAGKIAPRTLNTHLRNVVSFMGWTAAHYAGVQRVTSGKLAVAIKERPDEEREVFDDGDLAKLFGSKFATLPDHKRWLLLTGLCSGARIEEICQLDLHKDVYMEDGIWVFDFNDLDEKALKTKASKRKVPIHPELLRLGIIEYFDSLKARGHTRPFPQWEAYRGKHSKNASKWFGRYCDRQGVVDRRKTFHSFRHSALNAMKQAGIEEGKAASVAGQTFHGISYARYGKGYPPKALVDAVAAINYPVMRTL